MSFNNVNVNVSGPVQPTSTYKTKVLKGNHSFASQVTEPNTKYVIKHNFDLGGKSVTIPANCVLEFDGGSLSNGKITGIIDVKGTYNNKINVIIEGDIVTKDFVVVPISSYIDKSKIEACVKGCIIDGNIIIEKHSYSSGIILRTDLKGLTKDSSITFAEELNIGIEIQNTDNITISNITLIKSIPNTSYPDAYHFEVLRTRSCEHITITNCIINGGLKFINDKALSLRDLYNISITDNIIVADFGNIINSDFRAQKDVITIEGISDNVIENNYITAIDVNRVFKLCSVIGDDYYEISHHVNNTFIINNIIKSYTIKDSKQKQFIDCYIGTRSVYIKNNLLYLKNHNALFENKTTNSNIDEATVILSDNKIILDNVQYGVSLKGTSYINLICENNIFIYKNVDDSQEMLTYTIYTINIKSILIKNNTIKKNVQNTAKLYPIYLVANDYTENNITSTKFAEGQSIILNNVLDNLYEAYIGAMSFVSYRGNIVINRKNYMLHIVDSVNNVYCDFDGDMDNSRPTAKLRIEKSNTVIGNLVVNYCGDENIARIASIENATINTVKFPHNTFTSDGINYNQNSNNKPNEALYYTINTTHLKKGELIIQRDTDKYSYFNGTKWVYLDGATVGVSRSGTFNNKPSSSDIYVGFKYFCTDKQTTEGATDGIEIIHKGSDVWVDALGRVIS